MKNLSSYLLAMFMIMFWGFRIIVAVKAGNDETFAGFMAFNLNIEIILLFITLICFTFFVRRKIIGAIVYLISYGYYFGGYLITSVIPLLMEGTTLSIDILQNTMVAFIGIIIALCTFFDILFEKVKRNKYSDSKTDWFFNNKDTDRKNDERADENHYKFY